MKKLLFFINTLGKGGAEKVLVDLVNQLPQDKYDITIKVLYGGVHGSRLNDNIHYEEIIKTRNPFLIKLLNTFYVKVMSPKRFYNRFLKSDYDIECAYLEGFNTKIIANSTSEKAKKIAFVHTNFETLYGLETIYGDDAAAKEMYRIFDTVAFVSKAAEQGFAAKFGKVENGVVIHNVLDVAQIQEMSEESCDYVPCEAQKLHLISLGRLTVPKGYDRLLEALDILQKEGVFFHLALLGDGEERPNLEAFAKEHALDVDFLGFRQNPYPYIAKSDLFVCSSRTEGYSTAVTETVILGVPVLATDCAGMDEIFDNGKYGTVVENSTQGIADGLRQIASDETVLAELRMKAMQRQDFFSAEKNLKEYEELFM